MYRSSEIYICRQNKILYTLDDDHWFFFFFCNLNSSLRDLSTQLFLSLFVAKKFGT